MSAAATGLRPATTLDRLAADHEALVLEVSPRHASELQREGIVAGARVVVCGRAPLRGPLIVESGRARIAVARSIAATVVVATVTTAPEAGAVR